MKERDRGNSKCRWLARPTQKLVDDYTGAAVYSDNTETDYKGYVTMIGLADSQPVAELPVHIPTGAVPWIIRKETNPQDVAGISDPTWDDYDEYWNTSELEYGE